MLSITTSGHSASLTCDSRRVNVWRVSHIQRSCFGDLAVILFLMAQAADGALTYVGVRHLGLAVEANPLISWLIASFGEVGALAGAKLVAGSFGIALHLSAVHKVVAGLTLFYVVVAVFPWIAILYL
ncbi:MAG TPA: DUF5658 family protein [Vicinamibacterales bacterium]|jgi:hypothetical protein|nr:DUF5658 family protein [Vicinamibacterales bacterium]